MSRLERSPGGGFADDERAVGLGAGAGCPWAGEAWGVGRVVGCAFDDARYQRNTIAKTHWFELVLLCWKPGQATPIHDHEGSACAFKVIEGVATERRFTLENDGALTPNGHCHMPAGHVCAAKDGDIHLVVNEGDVDLITLHIYSPSLDKYNVYDHDQVVGGAVRMELMSVPLTVRAGEPAMDWVI